MKDSFIFYRSFYNAISKIQDKALKADIYEAICELALFNNDLELDDSVGQLIMELIKPQIQANNERYENGKKGGAPKGNTNAKKTTKKQLKQPMVDFENSQKQPNVNVNENVNANENVIKEKYKREKFNEPTLEEVQAYCEERNNGVDAERFIDFYSSKGWMVGKNKMKDWKAAVRTWERENQPNLPSWYGKEIKAQPLTPEEQKEFDDLIANF